MNFETDLLDIYDKHFRQVFEKLSLERTSSISESMGVVWYYQNIELKVQLVNDRGITDLLITGLESEDYNDAELLINMLKLNSEEPSSLTKNKRKKNITIRHGLSEQSKLLSNKYQ